MFLTSCAMSEFSGQWSIRIRARLLASGQWKAVGGSSGWFRGCASGVGRDWHVGDWDGCQSVSGSQYCAGTVTVGRTWFVVLEMMFDVRVVPAWSSRNSGEIGGVELFGVIFSEFSPIPWTDGQKQLGDMDGAEASESNAREILKLCEDMERES